MESSTVSSDAGRAAVRAQREAGPPPRQRPSSQRSSPGAGSTRRASAASHRRDAARPCRSAARSATIPATPATGAASRRANPASRITEHQPGEAQHASPTVWRARVAAIDRSPPMNARHGRIARSRRPIPIARERQPISLGQEGDARVRLDHHDKAGEATEPAPRARHQDAGWPSVDRATSGGKAQPRQPQTEGGELDRYRQTRRPTRKRIRSMRQAKNGANGVALSAALHTTPGSATGHGSPPVSQARAARCRLPRAIRHVRVDDTAFQLQPALEPKLIGSRIAHGRRRFGPQRLTSSLTAGSRRPGRPRCRRPPCGRRSRQRRRGAARR